MTCTAVVGSLIDGDNALLAMSTSCRNPNLGLQQRALAAAAGTRDRPPPPPAGVPTDRGVGRT
jgi:hypothetical protein